MADVWSRRVLVALLKRYGINPYRYRGQRRTTVMIAAPKAFWEETLWPAYQEISKTLEEYLSEVTDRVIRKSLDQNRSDVKIFLKPRRLSEDSPQAWDEHHEPEPQSPASGEKPALTPGTPTGRMSPKGGVRKKRKKKNRRR